MTDQERKPQQPNWAEIPTDALSVIFQKLGALHVLASAQAVCRPWQQLALDPTQEFWRCIDMRRLITPTSIPVNQESLARAAVDRSGGNIEELHVMYVSGDFLEYTANRATNIRCCGLISVYPLLPDELVDFVRRLPLLEELHIYQCHACHKTYRKIGLACPQLKCLWVEGNYDSDDGNVDSESEYDLTKMRRAIWRSRFANNGHLSLADKLALEIANTMPQLRELRLINHTNLTQKGVNAILDKCPHLEYLNIRRCYNVDVDDTLRAKLAKIKSVRLSRPCRISLADESAS